jgi:endoglucanase
MTNTILLVLHIGVCSLLTDNEPVRLAATGRLDLRAEGTSIENGQIVAGGGTIERMNWIPESDRPRSYTINFSVSRLAWREFAVQFTPVSDGVVTLALMGPWEEASKGVLYKQEVLWDSIALDGAALENGSFEAGDGRSNSGWQAAGGTVQLASQDVPAVDGRRVARTWHNATLTARTRVTAQKTVTIRGYARAVVPEGFREMRRLERAKTPAHEAARRFMHGTNLGNYLEAPPGQNWGASYSVADLEHIKAEGFDHVRIPIAWQHYTGPGPDYVVREDFFPRVDTLVNGATRLGLAVIVNVHHFDAFTSDPAGQRDKFLAIWQQVGRHYASAPPNVVFELLNEPKDAAATEVISPIYADAIRIIRQTNPNRTILVGPGKWNQVSELPKLQLPDDDNNLIVTVHCYEPFQFTHQGASWVGGDVQRVTHIQFPGPPDKPLEVDAGLKLSGGTIDWLKRYNTLPTDRNPSSPRVFRAVVEQAKEWSDYYGRPVHMGEFGAYIAADADSRARYYGTFRETMDKAGIGWATWDWKAGFRYWDDQKSGPVPGMRAALFPEATRK